MLTNYYTLRALIAEWVPRLLKSELVDSYSQHKGSLVLVFRDLSGNIWSLNTSVQAPNRHIFMYAGANRSRHNVVDLFADVRGKTVVKLDLADRDRLITVTLSENVRLHFAVYGPRANVFRESADSTVESFRGADVGIPLLRPASVIRGPQDIEKALARGHSLNSLLPLFPRHLVAETQYREGGTQDPESLFRTIQEIESELLSPTPIIYWDVERKPLFSLIRLNHIYHDEERCSTVDEAVRICTRRRLAIFRFSGQYDPLVRMLKNRFEQAQRSMKRIQSELSNPSRADRYELYGHLLMAQPEIPAPAAKSVQMPDIMSDGSLVDIPLDERLSAVENAQKYYRKAKKSRQARKRSLQRIEGLRDSVTEINRLYEGARNLGSLEEVKIFQTKNESALKALFSVSDDPDTIPYRRYVLDGGYEVWVGKSARQNDQLTHKDARKYDLWLHARGVAGSHTVLRLRGRDDKPPKRIIEQAAAIAAWHSKARPSSLVPVIVTQRKFVRKPRKSLPGTVKVEREKVILIEPGLPV